MKTEKAITLIALIITIIILVILAAVSIRAVYNMGIVNYANTIYIKSDITTIGSYITSNFTKQGTSDKAGYDKYVRH